MSELETKLQNSHLNGDDSDEKKQREEAEEWKEKGNEAFKSKSTKKRFLKNKSFKFLFFSTIKDQHYSEAIDFYAKAINLVPNEASYYGNRSFANLKTEFYGCALEDANKSIELDAKYLKGYYRRASANLAMGKYKLALKDYEFVTKLRPNDKDAAMKYKECDKIVKRIAFEKAIAVEDTAKRSIMDQIDVNAMLVEKDYSGPAFDFDSDQCVITLEFVNALIEHYKSQKVLHKKFAYKILFEIDKLFRTRPSMIDIKVEDEAKFTICGDIHGQFFDLLNIFKINGMPSETNPYVIKQINDTNCNFLIWQFCAIFLLSFSMAILSIAARSALRLFSRCSQSSCCIPIAFSLRVATMKV